MREQTFTDGWRRFWDTADRPGPVIAGFIVALLVASRVCDLIAWLLLGMVR